MKAFCLYVPVMLIAFISCNNSVKEERGNTPVNELTPSRSMYFDWININWYGGNESKVLQNLRFFKWLHDEYGMQLDIYLLDAGNLDNGPNCSGCIGDLQNAPAYGGIDSKWFRTKYPEGLDSIVALAKSFGCRIGLWIGPDGYGENDTTARQRINMLDHLTRDYDIALLKLDRCCSDLKPGNEKYFIEALSKCYANNPDLIVLNHRITLSDTALKYTTTFLWEGAETYIDVSSRNNKPSPHHRYTLERGLPPDLKRLTEDHGVCLSSYLDYWEDDLILQAFNRNLILAPEIYGNPWLLRDDELSLLARIFNLHKKYNAILTQAIMLPEETYGKFAVSRGDGKTRLISLRNLSWNPQKFTIHIDTSIGIDKADKIEVRQYHPYEKILGLFSFGQKVAIEVLPFRSCLLKISSDIDEFGIEGCNYSIVKELPGKDIEIDLLALPGEEKRIKLVGKYPKFTTVLIDGQDITNSVTNGAFSLKFAGRPLTSEYHRLLGTLKPFPVPDNMTPYIETMYFDAENNCLEVRSLKRSGETKIEAVKKAREAFFLDSIFIQLGTWDRFALDNDPATSFRVRDYCGTLPGVLRIKLPAVQKIDVLKIEGIEESYKPMKAIASNDLVKWFPIKIFRKEDVAELINPSRNPLKYIKLIPSPSTISEIKAYSANQHIDISRASASNLFPESTEIEVKKAWKGTFAFSEITKNSIMAVAIEGDYGSNGAFAVIQIYDSLIGAFDRSPAYVFNNWEHVACQQNGNYTYYFKIPANALLSNVTVYVFGLSGFEKIKEPQVWLTAYPIPFEKKRLTLKSSFRNNI